MRLRLLVATGDLVSLTGPPTRPRFPHGRPWETADPNDFGAACAAWELLLPPTCAYHYVDGTFVLDRAPPLCRESWCYVNKTKCNRTDIQPSARFDGLHYSCVHAHGCICATVRSCNHVIQSRIALIAPHYALPCRAPARVH
jgi:hypothetical protein